LPSESSVTVPGSYHIWESESGLNLPISVNNLIVSVPLAFEEPAWNVPFGRMRHAPFLILTSLPFAKVPNPVSCSFN
jgi:hypothetical protein